jgi:hypothetical protein
MKLDAKIKALKARCPLLFNVADKEEHPRCGFYIAEGWFPMVRQLCLLIEDQLVNFVPEEIRKEIYLAQVKEKFGGLRVYLNKSTPYIDGAIAFAEALSFHICEECGAPGELRLTSYHRTLCNRHSKLEAARKKESYLKYIAEQKARKELK